MAKIKTKLFIWWWLFSLFLVRFCFVLFYFAFGQVGFSTFLLWIAAFYAWKENKNKEEKMVILLCTYWVAPARFILKCSVLLQQFQGPLDYHISLVHWTVWLHWFMTRTVLYSVWQMPQLHHAESPSWNKQTNKQFSWCLDFPDFWHCFLLGKSFRCDQDSVLIYSNAKLPSSLSHPKPLFVYCAESGRARVTNSRCSNATFFCFSFPFLH